MKMNGKVALRSPDLGMAKGLAASMEVLGFAPRDGLEARGFHLCKRLVINDRGKRPAGSFDSWDEPEM